MSLSITQQNRLNRLRLLVTYRVDEYSEQIADLDSDDINFGDLNAELDGAATKVLTSIRREMAFRSAVSANSFVAALPDTDRGCAVIPLPVDYLRFVRLKMSGWKTPSNGLIPDDSAAYRLQQHPLHRGTVEKPKAFRVPYFGGSYTAGSVPDKEAYVTLASGSGDMLISVGDQVTVDDVGAETVTVKRIDDPDFIVIDDPTNALVVGDQLVPADDSYALIVKFANGDDFDRPSHKDAIEAYPNANGTIEEFVYVPKLKAYDIPEDLEDPLVWYATYRMLLVNERFKAAALAEDEYIKALNFINTGRRGEENEQSG